MNTILNGIKIENFNSQALGAKLDRTEIGSVFYHKENKKKAIGFIKSIFWLQSRMEIVISGSMIGLIYFFALRYEIKTKEVFDKEDRKHIEEKNLAPYIISIFFDKNTEI